MKLKPIGTISLLFIMLLFVTKANAQSFPNYYLIPKPESMETQDGIFSLGKNTIVNNNLGKEANAAIAELKRMSSLCSQSATKPGSIIFKNETKPLLEGGYKLSVKKDQIIISANTEEGALNAVSTIKQLTGAPLFLTKVVALEVPCVTITDNPRFQWRGMHFDVSRHFFDLPYLRKTIDRMAYFKLNKLHLHLTDDEGWRIEIKKYPELTQKGAWRTYSRHDSVCLTLAKDNPDYELPKKHFKVINGVKLYGGFYTQEEMKGLIKYAQDRGVEIIPEIDMPGHMMAATKLMPWLTSSGQAAFGKTFSEPLCPCKETTFEFAENVFSEIAALFPSQYIHLGADEVEKTSWEKSPECAELMKKEGIKGVEELQSYFVHRMEKFLNSKGKKMIGWDEILEGGISPTATLMYWRAWVPQAPKMAAEKGNYMIMTPGEYCYFDAQQDDNSLQKVYSFDPLNYNLTEDDKKFVSGIQGNVWTEYISTENRYEYMVYPRMLALAENAWSNSSKDWNDFENRFIGQLPLLDAMHINYRFPGLRGFSTKSAFVDKAELKVINPVSAFKVRYTTDGSNPTASSQLMPAKIDITQSAQFKVAAFSSTGRHGDVYTIDYQQQNYLEPVGNTEGMKNGLKFSYYPGLYKSVKEIKETDRDKQDITKGIEIPVANTAGSFATKHTGYFYAPETGVYTFFLRSDDGSVLKIGGNTLVDNDGFHTATEKTAQIALKKGCHPFELLFIEGGGGYTLQLQYESPSGVKQSVKAENFYN
ncbi:family 20 glycosylhydrolase [Solitalea canadensis]|uniref:beta-N-acetylhexosaminidase n=1 Tax=Solitalea canadensis (strain ATCC 29591 / DSM 3403 / JCM 21819 / LMG 8368 / NBRC 15130 / NCIMB 12057 / USAM 9D) TaxID=929556 RepID=H8KS03_SOLCM|nr:family 20 glycosylhydrolase [Solitalea canadensis]AFD07791.1 N-acetyl-beta-hexosaminidase [Solitalea canadensis DSM 3403]